MVFSEISDWVLNGVYQPIAGILPERFRIFLDLALFTLLIAAYALFIWKFYKFLARRNILELNLSRYNQSKSPLISKIFASLLYLIEYILIMPLAVFFWFGIFSGFLLILSESQSAAQVLLISAIVVSAVRFTSYFSEDLSNDLAKMIPLMVLSVFLLNPNFISVAALAQRFSELPLLLDNAAIYLVFIIMLEAVMRVIYSIVFLFTGGKKK
ncbi:hypothetical protein KY358_05245 [Candidatus Woesearchaeota archaeon]|nr:hypothetical protein [Candidatus Woesearchaeota archaeon]